jgi:hypothetical protein
MCVFIDALDFYDVIYKIILRKVFIDALDFYDFSDKITLCNVFLSTPYISMMSANKITFRNVFYQRLRLTFQQIKITLCNVLSSWRTIAEFREHSLLSVSHLQICPHWLEILRLTTNVF